MNIGHRKKRAHIYMTCLNMTETGLLAFVSVVAGTFLKVIHDFLIACRDSRCRRVSLCGIQCENELLSGEEIKELQEATGEAKSAQV